MSDVLVEVETRVEEDVTMTASEQEAAFLAK